MPRLLSYYFHKKSFKVAIALAIVLLIIYPFVFQTKKSFADEISLFPTICEGSWINVKEAAGDPVDNRSNGAWSSAAGDIISCNSFDVSSLPEDASITDAHIEFMWAAGEVNEAIVEPSIEESYDAVIPSVETEKLDEQSEAEILEPETIPTSDKENSQENPQEINNSTNQEPTEPTSQIPQWLSSLIIPMVRAEEQTIVSENSPDITEPNLAIPSDEQEIILTPETQIPSIENEISEQATEVIPSEENTTQNDIISEAENVKTEEIVGTALYNSSYTISGKKEQFLGEITHEQLSRPYVLPLTIDDITELTVSLKSLMTIDTVNNLTLQGVRLVVTYNVGESLDPIRQPNLEVDTILDEITVDDIQAIRIKRKDNKEYEIWYRVIEPTQQSKIDLKDTNIQISEIQEPISNIPEVTITNDVKPEKIEVDDQEDVVETEKLPERIPLDETISITTDTVKPEINLVKSTSGKKKRFYWNFVEGNDLVSKNISVALQDGYIFWLNKKGTALNSFNILTQGYNSQSYSPESGNDFIMYRSPSSQEKKAILNMTEQKFIFSE